MGSFGRDGTEQDGVAAGSYAIPTLSRSAASTHRLVQRPLSAQGGDADLRVEVLIRAIEHEIIPRLMLANRSSTACSMPALVSAARVSESEVDAFTALVIEPTEGALLAQIDSMRRRGIGIEELYLDLLTPVARRLGELWEQDLCNFSDVTIGLAGLHQALRNLSHAPEKHQDRQAKGLSILLAPCPGEQHSFGLVMVGEFFRRAGWRVETCFAPINPVDRVSDARFDVIGLSMGAEVFQAEMAKCVREAREASLNPGILVMVGGPAFLANPGLVFECRADAMAATGKEAPRIIESLLAQRVGESCGAKV